MTNQFADQQRVAIERERLEFEKKQASRSPLIQNHLGAILTAAVAFLAAVFSGAQIYIAHLVKQKELELARLQNHEEMDRRWRTDMLGFLERHEQQLLARDSATAKHALALLELSFPAQYVHPVRTKLRIIVTPTVPSDARRVAGQLLRPLVQQFDRTDAAFKVYGPGEVSAENELREGNQRARDLLVVNRDLIPEALRDDAARLVEHYEVWLQEYARLRSGERPNLQVPVYSGPMGYPFPRESERRFRAELARLDRAAIAN